MMYGDIRNGFSYSPDRKNDRINQYNSRSQFINANGSRQTGFFYSAPNAYTKPAESGWYDGAGRYHER